MTKKTSQESSLPKETAESLKESLNKLDHVLENLESVKNTDEKKDMGKVSSGLDDAWKEVGTGGDMFKLGPDQKENVREAAREWNTLHALIKDCIDIKDSLAKP